MLRQTQLFVGFTAIVVALAGCASSAGGGNQMQNTVYATHRLVQNLDRNLSASVNRLNETTAELITRVEAADTETRRLLSVVEENQVKIDRLQQRLDELTATLYRHLDLSPPSGLTSGGGGLSEPGEAVPQRGGVESGDVIVQPPPEPGPMEEMPEPEQIPTPTSDPSPAPTTEPGPGADDADAFYIDARELYTAEQYEEALEQFDAFLRRFPDSPNAANAQYWKAHSYFKLDRFERAVEEFQHLRREYPSSSKVPIALHNQAVAESRLGRVDAAIATFETLISEFPNDVVADMGRDKLRQLRELN